MTTVVLAAGDIKEEIGTTLELFKTVTVGFLFRSGKHISTNSGGISPCVFWSF